MSRVASAVAVLMRWLLAAVTPEVPVVLQKRAVEGHLTGASKRTMEEEGDPYLRT
jgi:hypothetical protein